MIDTKKSIEINGAKIIAFKSAADFESWLENNYKLHNGIWIKVAKKNSRIPSITEDEAVDIGLCWGWISGQRLSYDQSYYLQKYVPRRSRSIWSQVNVEKVKALTAAGRMKPSGLAEVTAAKNDGRWDNAYVSQRNATVPKELIEALNKHKGAKIFFEQLGKTEKYSFIFDIAKRHNKKDKQARIDKIIEILAAEEKLH